jgi:hypothetical protein
MIRTFANNRTKYGDIHKTANWHILTSDVADVLNNQLGQWKTNWSADQIRKEVKSRSLSAIIRHVYETEAQAHGKSRVFIKENQTFRFAPFLLASFPNARFIYLVRDPRDMVLSWKTSPSHPGCVYKGTQIWKDDQGKSLDLYGFLQDAERIMLLRYEDLVSQTTGELHRVCDFLQVSYSPSMLEFHQNALTVENSQRIRGWYNLRRPVLTHNFAKYRTGLDELEIRYIEASCQPEMEFFGYQPDFAPADDLASLEQTILELEQRTSVKPKTLNKDEEVIRARRLSVIQKIIQRKLWTNSNNS